MIRKWLIKHWWVNETLKIWAGLLFAIVSYSLYISEVRELAFVSGIMFVLCVVFFVDTLAVLIKKVKGKPTYESRNES